MLQGILEQKLKPPSSPAPLSLYWKQHETSICIKQVSPRSPKIVFPTFRLLRLHLSNPERRHVKEISSMVGLFWLHIIQGHQDILGPQHGLLDYQLTTGLSGLSSINDLQRGFVQTPQTPPPPLLCAWRFTIVLLLLANENNFQMPTFWDKPYSKLGKCAVESFSKPT